MPLVIGATGFIGRTLAARLAGDGHPVRVLVRHPGRADAILGGIEGLEIVMGDLLEPGSILRALGPEDTVVYLATSLSSLSSESSVEEADRRMLTNLCRALSISNPPRVIMLCPLFSEGRSTTKYAESRIELEVMLQESGIPCAIFRSPPVIGRWGILYRLLSSAVDRLSIVWMMPKVSTPCQPIFLGDVVAYIIQACTSNRYVDKVYEIAGLDVVTYREMLDLYSRLVGVDKVLFPVPFDLSEAAARFFARSTGIPVRAVRVFLESMGVPSVKLSRDADNDFPDIHPLGYLDAIQSVLREKDDQPQT